MKIICAKNSLVEGIGFVQKAVSSKTTLPILEGILLEADDVFKMTGNDLEIGIESIVEAQILTKGSVVINSRIFGDIIRRLPDDEVRLEVKENLNVIIESGNSHFEVKGLNPQNFPALPEITKETSFHILDSVLKDLIRQTIFAVSVDDNRPTLKGSLIEYIDEEVNIVSLDGFRIAHRKYYLMQDSKPFKAIVPGKTLNEIMKILSQGEENVTIFLSNNQILFETSKCKVISRLLEGEFLNYRNFIPKEYETKIKINCKQLLSSIERASLLTREDKRYPIRFDIDNDKIIISSSTELGDVREEVPIEMNGKKVEIGFNPKFFIDALRVIDDEEVNIEFTSNIGPCTVKPLEGESFAYMILPIRR